MLIYNSQWLPTVKYHKDRSSNDLSHFEHMEKNEHTRAHLQDIFSENSYFYNLSLSSMSLLDMPTGWPLWYSSYYDEIL